MKRFINRLYSFLFGLIIVLTVLISSALCEEEGYRYPAEWQPHEAIWMGFRTHRSGLLHEPLLQDMLRALTPHVRVHVIVEDMALLPEREAYFAMIGADPKRVDIVVQSPTDFWLRDPGPLFLVDEDRRMVVADFRHRDELAETVSASTQISRGRGGIDRDIAARLSLPVFESSLVMEGGAFEVNGKGTVLLTALTRKRNPHFRQADIEREVKKTLGQKHVIWLNEGLAQDPLGFTQITGRYWGRGAGGHTDEFVRFVDPQTILIAWISEEERDDNPVNQINYNRMRENYAILTQARDQDGHPFHIIKCPVPDLLTQEYRIDAYEVDHFQKIDPGLKTGDSLTYVIAASYLNYVVTNGAVLLPEYWREGRPERLKQKDAKMKKMMETAFPNRRIIALDPTTLNYYGGGMHCIVMQQPKMSTN